ncbi:MAG: hypothetical protein IPP77_00610 [Bacteroidetes bacterium]|nr:hypothetical protein [Bacteroidota bacterium]
MQQIFGTTDETSDYSRTGMDGGAVHIPTSAPDVTYIDVASGIEIVTTAADLGLSPPMFCCW